MQHRKRAMSAPGAPPRGNEGIARRAAYRAFVIGLEEELERRKLEAFVGTAVALHDGGGALALAMPFRQNLQRQPQLLLVRRISRRPVRCALHAAPSRAKVSEGPPS